MEIKIVLRKITFRCLKDRQGLKTSRDMETVVYVGQPPAQNMMNVEQEQVHELQQLRPDNNVEEDQKCLDTQGNVLQFGIAGHGI